MTNESDLYQAGIATNLNIKDSEDPFTDSQTSSFLEADQKTEEKESNKKETDDSKERFPGSLHERHMRAKIKFKEYLKFANKTGKGYGTQFYSLMDIVPRAEKILTEHGIGVYTTFTKETATLIAKDFYDDSSEIRVELPYADASIAKASEVQNRGGGITYLRRYLWYAFLDVTEVADAEDYNSKESPVSSSAVIASTPNHSSDAGLKMAKERMKKLAGEVFKDNNEFMDWIKTNNLPKKISTVDEAYQVINKIELMANIGM